MAKVEIEYELICLELQDINYRRLLLQIMKDVPPALLDLANLRLHEFFTATRLDDETVIAGSFSHKEATEIAAKVQEHSAEVSEITLKLLNAVDLLLAFRNELTGNLSVDNFRALVDRATYEVSTKMPSFY